MKLAYCLYLVFFLFSHISTAQTVKDRQIEILVSKYDFITEQKNKHPNQNHDYADRALGLNILIFDYMINNGRVDGGPTEATLKKSAELTIDTYQNECLIDSKSTHCSDYINRQARYTKEYGSSYTPVAPVYPKIDLANYTYTMPDGRIFDLKKRQYISAQEKKTEEVAVIADDVTEVYSSTGAATENTEPKTESSMHCEWIGSNPKKELTGANCSSNICTAMVVCNKNGRKIKRLATCSSELCAEGKATECAAQLGYASYPVNFNSKAPSNINSNKNDNSKSSR